MNKISYVIGRVFVYGCSLSLFQDCMFFGLVVAALLTELN